MGVLNLRSPDTKAVEWIFLNQIAGLGKGVLFPSMAYAVQVASQNDNIAFAVALFSSRAMVRASGVAIRGVAFQNQIKGHLLMIPGFAPMTGEYSKDAAALVRIIRNLPPGESRNFIVAYVDSLKAI